MIHVFQRHARAAVLFACAAIMLCAAPARAVTYTVSTTLDYDNGSCIPGDCTLREAINAANASAAFDTIMLSTGNYVLSVPGTDEDSNANGDLDVASMAASGSLTILGSAMNKTTIDASGIAERAFHGQSSNLYLSDLTIFGGNSSTQTSAFGGGILMASGGTLTLERVNMSSNIAAGAGGGAVFTESSASLSIRDSRIHNNQASSGNGGGVRADSGTVAMIERSEFSSNSAAGNGGAVSVEANSSASFYDSTLHANAANVNGGGIFLNSNTSLVLFNDTLTSNIADQNNDSSGDGGGFFQSASTSLVTLANTLLANNVRVPSGTASNCAEDLTGPPTSLGKNLIANTTGCSHGWIGSDITGVNPKFGAFGFNGASTKTYSIRLGSPARNAAASANCSRAHDQRGYKRIVGSTCDIGAYELGARADVGFTQKAKIFRQTVDTSPGVPKMVALRVRNNGADPAVGVHFTLRLPSGVTAQNTSANVSCSGKKVMRCTVRGVGIVAGTSVIVDISFTSMSASSKVVRGSMGHAGSDPRAANNSARITLV